MLPAVGMDSLPSSPISSPLISSSCFPSPASAESTVLKSIQSNAHPSLIPDVSGIATGFSPFRMTLAVDFSLRAFIMLRYVPSSLTFFRTLP